MATAASNEDALRAWDGPDGWKPLPSWTTGDYRCANISHFSRFVVIHN